MNQHTGGHKAAGQPVYECLTANCRTITFLPHGNGPLCPSCHEPGAELN